MFFNFIIDNIELTKFTLGHRTPYLKYLRVFDMSDDLRKLLASEVTYRNPPKDLPVRPKYQVVLEADMGLDAPESQMIIQLKLNSRMYVCFESSLFNFSWKEFISC